MYIHHCLSQVDEYLAIAFSPDGTQLAMTISCPSGSGELRNSSEVLQVDALVTVIGVEVRRWGKRAWNNQNTGIQSTAVCSSNAARKIKNLASRNL